MSIALDVRAQRQQAQKQRSSLLFGGTIAACSLVVIGSLVTVVTINRNKERDEAEARAPRSRDIRDVRKILASSGPMDEREIKRRKANAMEATCTFSAVPQMCRDAVNRMRQFEQIEEDLRDRD